MATQKTDSTAAADRPAPSANDLPTPILPALVENVGGEAKPDYQGDVDSEYSVRKHDVFNPALRKDRKKKDGTPVYVNRIGLPLQKLIVNRRVGFMNVGEIKLEANPKGDDQERLYDMIKKIREDNKMDFVENDIATRMLSELQVAKLWYSQPVDKTYWGELVRQGGKVRMRCEVLSPRKGDKLLPVFDRYGDLVYFGRAYKSPADWEDITDANVTSVARKEERLDVYSSTHIYKFRKAREGESVASIPGNNGWILDGTPARHSYGKIPVIYYSKPEPPWADVQHSINRLEKLLSNFADTIDYNAYPTKIFIGDIVGSKIGDKEETGGAVQIKPTSGTTIADMKYATWDHAPEAIKLEIDTLAQYIFTCTQTPQMAMEDMKELGNVSGVAYDRIFMDAHLAAKREIQGEYGMSTQREINFLKAACAAIDTSLAKAAKELNIGFYIPLFRINDDKEEIDKIAAAIKAGILSKETALQLFSWINDAKEEWERLVEEREQVLLDTKQNFE